MKPILLLALIALTPAAALPALSQSLGKGDYEMCSVYDRDDEFAGYDSVCLAERRAALRYLNEAPDYADPDPGYGSSAIGSPYVYTCPAWANGGNGYNMTWYSDGRSPTYFGTFDSTMNGQPCIANPVYLGTGYY